MAIEPGSEEEKKILAKWIRTGRGLIVGGSPLGDSYIDPNVVRDDDVGQRTKEYVELDHQLGEQLPHLKGKFRYELEKYFSDNWGPYLPLED